MKIKKYNLTLLIISIIVSIIASFLGMVYAKTTAQFLICFLPLVYISAVTLSGAFLKFIDSSSPGIMIINCLYFIKCVIYPFINVVSGSTYNSGNMDTAYAIILESGEIIIIYTIYYLYCKFDSSPLKCCIKYSLYQNNLQNGNYITSCFLIVVLFVIICFPGSLSSYNFFTVESLDVIYAGISEADTNGVVSLTIKVARYVLAAYLLERCYRKYQQTNLARYWILAIAVVALTMMIVRGVSRSDFVIPGACGLFLLIRMFPKHKKIISISLLGCLAVVFVTFSLMRYGKNDSMSELSETLQVYFCCEKNMAIAIEARRIYADDIGINTFLSDLLGNWAGIGGLFTNHYNISEYFNFAYHGHMFSIDQIVPTIGQSYMQFGLFGTYTYTIVMVVVCLTFDKKYRQSDKIDFSYLYLYGSIKCAVTLMGNLKIFSATVFNVLFPMYLLFWLNSRIFAKRKSDIL